MQNAATLTDRVRATAFVPVYSAFAAGYLLSYLYRTINAVISPELTGELGLTAASLGLLTSAYFLAFGLMQIPVGILLDRFGPRRVEPVLLLIAATGALIFAFADGLTTLTVGRAIIGAGVCACLMAPLKGIAMWYPAERQASLAGWMMVAGGIGALAATAPAELALRIVDWRTIFIVLATMTFGVALWIAWRVPDTPPPTHATDVRSQWAGVREIYRHPRFWWIAPLAGFGMGVFMAIQGLWAVPWMMEVQGLTRGAAATVLLVMSVVVLVGYVLLGSFATALDRRGIRARHLFAAGFTMSAFALACITLEVPGSLGWWSLYGFGVAANVLAFPVTNEGFPRDYVGRTNTAINLFMFIGSFVTQWGIGGVVDAIRATAGVDAAAGLRYAFALVLALDVLALAWFFRGWKRFAHPVPAS
ncbi:MAG TPA: MFS transporter [Casimicrobiaceae bacterium]|nr:MFS transporter [Casimicrobiaceae bacterium]